MSKNIFFTVLHCVFIKKMQELVFVLKDGHLFFASLQVILTVLVSNILDMFHYGSGFELINE